MLLAYDLSENSESDFKQDYVSVLTRVERLHRRLLDLIRYEFERMEWRDVTPVQALLLFNIGHSEVTPSEIKARGYYLGTNVTYNLKQLLDGQYLSQERSLGDRRNVRIRLTPKGEEVAEVVSELYDRHIEAFRKAELFNDDAFHQLAGHLERLERFWLTSNIE